MFLLLGAEGRQLRQGRRQGLAGGQQGQVGTQSPALIGGRQRCPAACRRRLGIAFNADAFDQQPSGQGAQTHGISGEKHPIEGAAHRLAIADPDHQSGPLAIDQHLGQGPQPRRGGDAAGGKPLAALGQLQGLAGLAMQESQHIGPVEAQQADRPIAAPGLGLEGARRDGGIPGEDRGGHGVGGGEGGQAVGMEAAAALLARAATSLRRNRLESSRPAALRVSRPPSCRSTIATTRSTR